jgi:hypothetical protein
MYVPMTEVEVGQVWEDTDPRQKGRTVEVMAVQPALAIVRLNTPGEGISKGAIGRRTRIKLVRFPIDYKLSDVEPHRFGTSTSGELGYHPVSALRSDV